MTATNDDSDIGNPSPDPVDDLQNRDIDDIRARIDETNKKIEDLSSQFVTPEQLTQRVNDVTESVSNAAKAAVQEAIRDFKPPESGIGTKTIDDPGDPPQLPNDNAVDGTTGDNSDNSSGSSDAEVKRRVRLRWRNQQQPSQK